MVVRIGSISTPYIEWEPISVVDYVASMRTEPQGSIRSRIKLRNFAAMYSGHGGQLEWPKGHPRCLAHDPIRKVQG